jgi:hypothetical protein
MVHVWKEKNLERKIIAIHAATILNTLENEPGSEES